jgi:hypothetical protein
VGSRKNAAGNAAWPAFVAGKFAQVWGKFYSFFYISAEPYTQPVEQWLKNPVKL